MNIGDYKELHKALKDAGYVLHTNGHGHYKVIDTLDNKQYGSLPCTPSDHRSLQNDLATLRRKGVDLERKLGVEERKEAAKHKTETVTRLNQALELAQRHKELTAEILVKSLGVKPSHANIILADGLKRGVLMRVKRGVYKMRTGDEKAVIIKSAAATPPQAAPQVPPAPLERIFVLLEEDPNGSVVLKEQATGHIFVGARLHMTVSYALKGA